MEDTQGEVTAEVAENAAEPFTPEQAEVFAEQVAAFDAFVDYHKSGEAAANSPMAEMAIMLEEDAPFVPLPGHEIQHTAHLTDGPPW